MRNEILTTESFICQYLIDAEDYFLKKISLYPQCDFTITGPSKSSIYFPQPAFGKADLDGKLLMLSDVIHVAGNSSCTVTAYNNVVTFLWCGIYNSKER